MRTILALILLVGTTVVARGQCVEPSAVVDGVVGIYSFNKHKQLVGGTAWFVTNDRLKTNAHVVRDMELDFRWQMIQIRHAKTENEVPVQMFVYVRVVEFARRRWSEVNFSQPYPIVDDIAELELRQPRTRVIGLPQRSTPLALGEKLFTVGYPDWQLHFAFGRRVKQGPLSGLIKHFDWSAVDLVPIEVDRNGDRMVMKGGSSGSPVFDCAGKVAATLVIRRGKRHYKKGSDGSEYEVWEPTSVGESTNMAVPLFP